MNPFAMVLFWALIGLLIIQLPFLTNFISVVQKHLLAAQRTTDRFEIAGTGATFSRRQPWFLGHPTGGLSAVPARAAIRKCKCLSLLSPFCSILFFQVQLAGIL